MSRRERQIRRLGRLVTGARSRVRRDRRNGWSNASDVPFGAVPTTATVVVLARRSVLGGVRVIADSEGVGSTHRTESRRQFCQPCGRTTRPTSLLPLLRPVRSLWGRGVFGLVGGGRPAYHCARRKEDHGPACRPSTSPRRLRRHALESLRRPARRSYPLLGMEGP